MPIITIILSGWTNSRERGSSQQETERGRNVPPGLNERFFRNFLHSKSVQDLLQNKARLEHDLKIKSNSLFIDREKCLSIRKSFPVVSLATKLQTGDCEAPLLLFRFLSCSDSSRDDEDQRQQLLKYLPSFVIL